MTGPFFGREFQTSPSTTLATVFQLVLLMLPTFSISHQADDGESEIKP